MALLNEDEQLLEHRSGSLDLGVRAFQGHLVPARDESHPREMGFDLAEVPVGLPQEIQHQMVAGDA
jgi:hypothetical protein